MVFYLGDRCLGGGVIEAVRAVKRLEDQVLALAGVVQVARLVDQISRTGSYPEEFLAPADQQPVQVRRREPRRTSTAASAA